MDGWMDGSINRLTEPWEARIVHRLEKNSAWGTLLCTEYYVLRIMYYVGYIMYYVHRE